MFFFKKAFIERSMGEGWRAKGEERRAKSFMSDV